MREIYYETVECTHYNDIKEAFYAHPHLHAEYETLKLLFRLDSVSRFKLLFRFSLRDNFQYCSPPPEFKTTPIFITCNNNSRKSEFSRLPTC